MFRLATLLLGAGLLSAPGGVVHHADILGAEPPALHRLDSSLRDLTARVRPSVVQIFVSSLAPASRGELLRHQSHTGSGVILDSEGYVVTNAHVVEGARRVQIHLARPPRSVPRGSSILAPPGATVGARIVGIDLETDLAVLKIPAGDWPALELADSDALQPGQLVLAFGSPVGLENSVTLGIISATARQLRREDPMIYVQTDAAINPGNSGGPLVDLEGRVVGINTLIFSQSGGNEGIGFAAPSNIVRNVYEQIRHTGRVRRGTIGVRPQTIEPTLAAGLGLPRSWGVILADVLPGSPAAISGLRIGDIVVSLDGKPMENGRQLDVNLYTRSVGEMVEVEIERGARRFRVHVPVTERSDDPVRFADLVHPERNRIGRLGVLGLDVEGEVLSLLPLLRKEGGVLVAAQIQTGAPGSGQLELGDVIHEVNGNRIAGVDALRTALMGLPAGTPVVLQVERAGLLLYVSLELP